MTEKTKKWWESAKITTMSITPSEQTVYGTISVIYQIR